MTSARRQLRAAAGVPAAVLAEDVPDCLRAGRCVEVWDPAGGNAITTWVRYGRARHRWLDQHGIGPGEYHRMPAGLYAAAPWSYAELAQHPEALAEHLRRRGLPAGWTPQPAPAAWTSPQ